MSGKIQVDKYFAALQRLVDRDVPINNDSVALEAGSGRGSIKKSRGVYAELIEAIDLAEKARGQTKVETDPAPALRNEIQNLMRRLDEALEREICLLDEVYTLREEVRQLKLGRPMAVPNPK